MEVPSPPPLVRAKRTRKKPDLTGVEPKEITIRTTNGEKTFSARSKPKLEKPEAEAQAPEASNPWSSLMNSWLD